MRKLKTLKIKIPAKKTNKLFFNIIVLKVAKNKISYLETESRLIIFFNTISL